MTLNAAGGSNYTTGVQYSVTVTSLIVGSYTFYFQASDDGATYTSTATQSLTVQPPNSITVDLLHPFSELFSSLDYNSSSTYVSAKTGWSNTTSSTSTWYIDTSDYNSAPSSIGVDGYGIFIPAAFTLTSPRFYIAPGLGAHLSFAYQYRI